MKYKTLLLSLLYSISVQGQTNLNSAWESFFKNDRAAARVSFNNLVSDPVYGDESQAALFMLASMDKSPEEGFYYMDKLFRTSKNPEPYLLALWSDEPNYSKRIKSPAQLEFYKALSASKNVDGSLHAMANSLLGTHYTEIRDYDEANKYYAKIGDIKNWLITGEYENISTSGFDKSYETLKHPELNYIFTGKNNRKFSWRTVPYTRRDRWFDFTYYNTYKNALQFAQTFVKAPEDVSAQLRIGVSGSVKVWVNDQLLISESEERNNDLDAYISPIKLRKGYNRILVQIAESYANNSNFLLRITDEQGNPINKIIASSTPEEYTKEEGAFSNPIHPPGFDYFKNALKQQPESYINQLMMAKLYLRLGNVYEARLLLEKLKNKWPESTYLNTMMLDLFSKADNRTGTEALKEAIKASDPESNIALQLLYNNYNKLGDNVRAQEIIEKLEKIYGENEDVVLKKINILSKEKNQPAIIALVERVYSKLPNSPDIAELKYIIESQIRMNPDAMSILQKYLDENDDYKAAKYIAKLYLDKGEIDKGIAIYRNELKNDPIGYSIYTDLAGIYYRLQRYDEAEKLYMEVLEIDRNSAFVHSELGLLYDAKKQKEKSIKAYETSLQIDPNNYSVIQALRTLQGKKQVFDYFDAPDIKAMSAKIISKDQYPDDHYIVLNNEVQKVVYKNGGSEEKHFFTARILTQTGLDNMKEYTVPFTNEQNYYIELAEVIKPNGTKAPAEINNNELVFTNLEVGDVINIRHKLENFHTGAMSSHFWDSFYFSDGLPHQNIKYSLLIHEAKPFKYVFSQEDIPLVKLKKDEFELYVWNKSNQEALSYEDKMPPMDDVTNILYVSTIPDWKYIIDWYNNIASAKARSSYEIKQVVDDLFKDRKNLDPLTKVKMIYNYITSNISYSSVSFRQSGIVPQNPATVINTRIGDCKDVSTLFVAMCKEAGISANLALANTRNRGQNTLLLPSIEFNHCIAKANIDGKEYWVELTARGLPFNTFGNSFFGSNILEISDSGSKITRFAPKIRGKNIASYKTSVQVNNSDMILKESNLNTGAMSAYLRNEFLDLSSSDRLKKIKEQLSSMYPQNEVYDLKFTNLDISNWTSDTVGTETHYKLMNVSKVVAGMSIFSIPWSNKVYASSLQLVSPRKFGIDLSQMFGIEETAQVMQIDLPPGKIIVEPLKSVNISNDFIDYTIETSLVENKLILKRNFRLKEDYVPMEKIEKFKIFFKEMVEADDQSLAIK